MYFDQNLKDFENNFQIDSRWNAQTDEHRFYETKIREREKFFSSWEKRKWVKKNFTCLRFVDISMKALHQSKGRCNQFPMLEKKTKII